MGRDLLAREPEFAASIAAIDAALQPLVGWSVLEMLRSEAPASLFEKTEIAQPALFALQVGVVDLLRRRGIAAEAMLGHSVGEVAAAHAAGALTLEQACLSGGAPQPGPGADRRRRQDGGGRPHRGAGGGSDRTL